MTDIQHVPPMDRRPETGPMQFGDDWPGVFIRGDHAAWYAMMLERVANTVEGPIEQAQIRGLMTILGSCVVRPSGQ